MEKRTSIRIIRPILLYAAFVLGMIGSTQKSIAYTPPIETKNGIVYPISLSTGTDAEGKVIFPDKEFLSYIRKETFWTGPYEDFRFDLNGDGKLSREECELVRVISVTNHAEVKTVKGIKAFPKLRELYVSGSGIAELDLSYHPRLQIVKAARNALTTLDVTGCPLLHTLEISESQLAVLDVRANPKLQFLTCNNQQRSAYQYMENGQYRVNLKDLDKKIDLTKVHQVKIDGSAGDGVNTGYDEKTGMAYCSDKMDKLSYTYDVGVAGEGDSSVQTELTVTLNLRVAWRESFQTNGGSVVLARYVAEGEKDSEPEKPKKDGYFFSGWYQSAGCEADTKWTFGTPLAQNTVLYAAWTKKKYTVFYHPNGGNMTQRQKKEKVDWWTSALLPEYLPTRIGYQLKGFRSETGRILGAEHSNITYGVVSGNSDKPSTTLTAVWQVKTGYQIRYTAAVSKKLKKKVKKLPSDVCGGKITWTSSHFLPKEKPQLKGYRFIGWYTARKGGKKITAKTVYSDLFALQYQGDDRSHVPTVYARFQKKKFKIQYLEAGGTKVKDRKNIVWGSKNLLPKKKTQRKNYKFMGWTYKGKKVTKKTKINAIATGNEKVIKLKARWKRN